MILKRIVIFLLLAAMTGCAGIQGPYGTITPDASVQKGFEAQFMDPDMNYYCSGPDLYANAVIGLKKDYVLDNDLWKPMEPNPKVFRATLVAMKEKAWEHGNLLHGFAIKDDQGKAIGVWYSILGIKTMIIRMGPGNRVVVYTPELIIFPINGGDGGKPGSSK